jgi:hypothetical protein
MPVRPGRRLPLHLAGWAGAHPRRSRAERFGQISERPRPGTAASERRSGRHRLATQGLAGAPEAHGALDSGRAAAHPHGRGRIGRRRTGSRANPGRRRSIGAAGCAGTAGETAGAGKDAATGARGSVGPAGGRRRRDAGIGQAVFRRPQAGGQVETRRDKTNTGEQPCRR